MPKFIKTYLLPALAVVALQAINSAHAAGFALVENSASGQGNAFAGAAAIANDASTVWFNPAGMMQLDADQLAVVGNIIKFKAAFSNTNSTASPALGGQPLTGKADNVDTVAPVADFYIVKKINDNLRFGFAYNTPFGLSTEYNDNWIGRYSAVKTQFLTFNFNPSIAFNFNDKLSFGAGINLMLATVKFTSAVDFGALCYAYFPPGTCTNMGATPQSADGYADLSADNYSNLAWGINFGLLYHLSPSTRIGMAYRSRITLNVVGKAKYSVPAAGQFAVTGGSFINTGLKSSVTLPDSLSLSFASDQDKWTWLADLTWTDWSTFNELRITYDNPYQPDSVTSEKWKNTLRYSAGANYRYNDKLTLRGGWAYDETPIPDATHRTPRIPGNSRRWISLGFGYKLNKAFNIDLGYSHLFISDAQINNTFESGIPTLASTVNGTYSASADVYSAQLNWKY